MLSSTKSNNFVLQPWGGIWIISWNNFSKSEFIKFIRYTGIAYYIAVTQKDKFEAENLTDSLMYLVSVRDVNSSNPTAHCDFNTARIRNRRRKHHGDDLLLHHVFVRRVSHVAGDMSFIMFPHFAWDYAGQLFLFRELMMSRVNLLTSLRYY